MIAFDDHVAVDSWARVVDLFVDILPLEELGFKEELAKEGRPPYSSSDLLKLFLYGYKSHLRSSRRLAHACKDSLEVIWLMKGLRPSARKIAYFRKNNAKAFKNAFRHFVLILKQMNLIDGATIAIDSFKIRAQNSLKNNFNQKKIDYHLSYIDNKIAEYEKELDQADIEEKQQEIQAKIDHQRSKHDNYKSIAQQLHDSGQSQISLNDPDARSVILHRNITNVGYCVQAGCDSKHKLFVNNDTGSVNDTRALASMAIDAKQLLGVETMDVLADKGYTTGYEIHQCTQNGITTYCSPKESTQTKKDLFSLKKFQYDPQSDTYICPNNVILNGTGNVYHKNNNVKVKHYKNYKACNNCPLSQKCTKSKKGRLIERSIYQEDLEENAKRVNENPEYYRERQQVTEHQFGTLKRHWGFTYVLMKKKEHVLTEVNLMMICYNLRRLMSIFSINELKNRLKSLYSYFLASLAVISAFLSNHEFNNSKYQHPIFKI
jgi:transposase